MKLYDRKQIGVILKKAAEDAPVDEPDSAVGLSVEELQQVARAAGIDPARIPKAVAELESAPESGDHTFWGGPFAFDSQVLANGEIDAGQWEEMLVAIRAFFRDKGDVTVRDSVFEWSSPWGTTNAAHVTARKDNGKTRISVHWHGPLTAVPYYLPVPVVTIGALIFASGVLEWSAVPGLTFTALAAGLAFVTGRLFLRRNMAAGLKKLRNLTASLDQIAGARPAGADIAAPLSEGVPTGEKSADPVLQLPDEPTADEPDSQATVRGRSRA
ncbi:MAG: hypothetical protein RIE53_01040 [Rhodothermales bacterium]